MPGAQLGLNARLYIGDVFTPGTAPADASEWNVTNNVRDCTLDLTKGTADVTTRANNGFVAIIGTLKDATLKFTSVWNDADAQFLVLSDAFMDNTQLWALVLDKELGVAGTTATGLMAWMEVVGFVRNEQLTEGITVDFSLKPAYNLTLPPVWRTIVTPP